MPSAAGNFQTNCPQNATDSDVKFVPAESSPNAAWACLRCGSMLNGYRHGDRVPAAKMAEIPGFKDIKVEPLSENNLVGPSADKPFSQARAMLAGVAHFSPDAQTTQIFQRLGRIKEEAAVHFSRQVFSPGPTVQPPIINHRKMSPKTLSPSPRKKFLFIKHSAVFIHLNKTNSSS
jgi:hypothetical protein